jgi:hypothetical protein
MAEGTERRRNSRYGVGAPVRIIVENGHTIPGTMQNASQNGMLVALPIELELGRTYEIEVTDSQGVFCVNGEALRLHLPPRAPDGSQASGSMIGFEFVGMDAIMEKRLGRLLEEVGK